MTKDLPSLKEEQGLSLQVAEFDDRKLAALSKSHSQLRQAAIEKGLQADRSRVLKAFTPEKIEEKILDAMAEGKSSFSLDLGWNHEKGTSAYWNYRGALSRQVLGELNQQLRSSTMLSHAKLGKQNLGFDRGYFWNGWTILTGLGSAFSLAVLGVGIVATAGASFGALPAVSAAAASAYGGYKITKGAADLVNHYVYDQYYDDTKLTVHFNNPNKGILSLPARAIHVLGNGVRSVLDSLNPAKPSARKVEELKSAFSRSYKEAAQGVIEGAQNLMEHASKKGLEFSVDLDRFTELSNRQIELVEQRYEAGGFAQRAERVITMPLKDIGKAMKEAAQMVTIDQEHLSKLQTAFGQMVEGVEANVAYAESEVRMRSISDIGVGLNRLIR